MVKVQSAYLDCKLSANEFLKVVESVSQSEYKGTIYSMCFAALSSLGINKITNRDLSSIKPYYYQYAYAGDGQQNQIHVEGEIFKHPTIDKTFFFLIYGPAVDIKYQEKISSYRLESGIITAQLENIHELLHEFQIHINKSLNKFTKQKDSISWLQVSDKIDFNKFTWYKSNKSFSFPNYSKEELDASITISNKEYRGQLRNISQAGFAREQDLFGKDKSQKNNEELEEIIKELAKKGILRTQGLLQCRKKQSPLMRLDDAEQMDNETIRNLKCGLCGANYGDELIIRGYGLSDLGKKLLDKSHWMTILITEELITKGLEKDSVLWNITDANEEVDLIVGQKDQLWIFELKDRDFGTGDAYALNYRRSKFNATKPVIFTTEKVSNDAKNVFNNIINEVSHNVKNNVIPIYIEGIRDLSEKLDGLISEITLEILSSKIKTISNVSKINFIPAIERTFKIDLSRFDEDNDLPF